MAGGGNRSDRTLSRNQVAGMIEAGTPLAGGLALARGGTAMDGLPLYDIYEEVTARAIKRVIARQLDALMEDHGLTKSELAKRMKTRRAQLDRLLDPDNESVTLGTLARAAQAVGRHLRNAYPTSSLPPAARWSKATCNRLTATWPTKSPARS